MPMKISGGKVLVVIPTSREGLGGKVLMVIPTSREGLGGKSLVVIPTSREGLGGKVLVVILTSQEGRGGEILVMAHTSVLEGILLKEIQGRVTLTEMTFLGWRKNNRKSHNCLGNPEVAP